MCFVRCGPLCPPLASPSRWSIAHDRTAPTRVINSIPMIGRRDNCRETAPLGPLAPPRTPLQVEKRLKILKRFLIVCQLWRLMRYFHFFNVKNNSNVLISNTLYFLLRTISTYKHFIISIYNLFFTKKLRLFQMTGVKQLSNPICSTNFSDNLALMLAM